jgi:hypothetical protein
MQESLEPRDRHTPEAADLYGRRELAGPAKSVQRVAMDTHPVRRFSDADQVGIRHTVVI